MVGNLTDKLMSYFFFLFFFLFWHVLSICAVITVSITVQVCVVVCLLCVCVCTYVYMCEQDTEPLFAPDVQCAISVNVKKKKMCIHPCKSLWIKASAKCNVNVLC